MIYRIMLNLTIGMLSLIRILSILLFQFWAWAATYLPAQFTQDEPVTLAVTSPANGDALQGVISIQGTTDLSGYQSAEISFGYADDPTSTWFLIQQSNKPVLNGQLAIWDTSTISDGEYRLRVQVYLKNGKVIESIVEDLRVRNYTVIETSTPAPAPVQEKTAPVVTSTPAYLDYQAGNHTPIALPTNPLVLTKQDLQSSALKGVMVILSALIITGIYLGSRLLFRRL